MTTDEASHIGHRYYLTFYDSAGSFRRMPRFRRWHPTLEAARAEAHRVYGLRSGEARNAEPAVIYGPDDTTYSTG